MGCPAPAPGVERHKPRSRGGDRPRGGARGQPPALPEPWAGLAEPEQQEKLTLTGGRGAVLWFHFGIFFSLEIGFWGFFLFWNIGSVRKKMTKKKEKHILLPLWFGNRSSGMWFGVSDGISPPGATVGVLPPPSTHSRVRHRAGDPGPQMPPGTAEFPLQVGSVLNQGTEGTPVLSSLFLTLHFCLDRNFKQKKRKKKP